MGPLFPSNDAADTLAWANYHCQNAADGHEWAQHVFQEMMPIPLNGLLFHPNDAADTLAWAH